MKLLIGKINKIFILSFIFFGATAVKSDKLPIFVPLSQTDLDDPQVGYMHVSIGMEGGTYFFGNKGDPIERTKKLELERFTFFKDRKKEVIKGFIPNDAVCFFNNNWKCFIFSSWEDARLSLSEIYAENPQSTHKTDIMFCEDCKPIPEPALTRICAGLYQNYITGYEFKDKTLPTYPDFFTKDGDCKYEKPWTVSSNNQRIKKTDNDIENIDQAIILQSAFNRCMIEEKVWKKEQVLKVNREGAKVTPKLFNPVIEIIENGATKSQKKEQNLAIKKLGGCKNYIRTFISMTMKKDSEEMMKILDKIGFNDDLLGRSKSYFDKDQRVVFCKEPIPEFTLNYDSNPTNKEVETLCSCLWNKFPEGRWERDEMRRIFKGGDPNLKTRGFFPRFNKAMNVCDAYKL